ncbi:NADP-dependent oxidoreductase domain-containing protein, partial [Crepidotus variabilis]
ERSFERDIIPMARSEGMALAPWNVLAGGKIRTDEEEERRRETGEHGRKVLGPEWERTEDERKVCKALEKVASEIGAKHITAVAIAYVMQKTTYVFPIIGGRKVEHLEANLEALSISLTQEQIKYLESVVAFDPGFPMTMLVPNTASPSQNLKLQLYQGDGTGPNQLLALAAQVAPLPLAQPLRPTQ